MFNCSGFQSCDDEIKKNKILSKWLGSTIYVLAAPITTAVFLVDPLIRTICSIASILTLGMADGINQAAAYGRGPSCHDAGHVFVVLHSVIVNMLNPWAKLGSAKKIYNERITLDQGNPPQGYLTVNYALPLFEKASNCADEKEAWKARGNYTLGTLVITATKVAEFTAGLVAAAISIATFGLIALLNDFATEHLYALDGIHRILTGLRAIINPTQTFLDFGREFPSQQSYHEDVGCCTRELPSDGW